MKRRLIWLGAVVVVIAAVVGIRAETHRWHGWHGHFGSWGPMWYAAHELNLTEAQKQQIGTIWNGERPRVAGLVRELAAENVALRDATRDKNEAGLQEIASQQGATVAKLLIEKEKICSEIYTSVLDEKQKEKADELQGRLSRRLDRLADRLEQGGPHGK